MVFEFSTGSRVENRVRCVCTVDLYERAIYYAVLIYTFVMSLAADIYHSPDNP